MGARIPGDAPGFPAKSELPVEGHLENGVEFIMRGANETRINAMVGDLEESVAQASCPHKLNSSSSCHAVTS